jgi:membrane protease subunit HflK
VQVNLRLTLLPEDIKAAKMTGKSFRVFAQILQYIIKYFKLIVLFAVVIIVLSGIYRVESNEVAVVLRFGRLTGTTLEEQTKKPGLHFALPFFIFVIIKIPVHTVHEREITTHYGIGRGLISSNIERNGYILTGDNNIVMIMAKIKYQIEDAAQYILFSSDVGMMLEGIVSGEFTRTVTHMDIDLVLTSGRTELASEILKNSQVIIDELKIGVVIISVELTGIIPPAETVNAFEEVRNAAVAKETGIQQARERAMTQILNAEAAASAAKQTAISEQTIRLTKARDEMAEFNGLYGQYVLNPQIIMTGTFRQRVSAVLAKAGGSIVVPGGGSPVIMLP